MRDIFLDEHRARKGNDNSIFYFLCYNSTGTGLV
jgi:hypothetical protein